MKTIFSTALTLAFIALPSTSHALVRELALCTTADGKYRVSVQEPVYTYPGDVQPAPEMSAEVTTVGSDIAVAQYGAVRILNDVQPASFARLRYADLPTEGKEFLLAGPSTNAQNYILHVSTKSMTIDDSNLSCTIFEGKPVSL